MGDVLQATFVVLVDAPATKHFATLTFDFVIVVVQVFSTRSTVLSHCEDLALLCTRRGADRYELLQIGRAQLHKSACMLL